MNLYEEMCPNCVSPWKCNEPHIPYGSKWRKYPKIYNFLHNRFGFDSNIVITSDGGAYIKSALRYLLTPNVKSFLNSKKNETN